MAGPFTAGGSGEAKSVEPTVCSLADIAAYTALALQRMYGHDVSFTRVFSRADENLIDVVYEFNDPIHGELAGRGAVVLLNAALADQTTSADRAADAHLRHHYGQITTQLKNVVLGVMSRRIVWEAERRGIPWSRDQSTQPMVQLGQGHKLRRFHGGFTGDTSFLATKLATSKRHVIDLFRDNGIPVPDQVVVTDSEAAVAAARNIGFPVVVKPNSSDMGVAVSINLRDDESVRAAFAAAHSHGPVIVEQQITGHDHRCTVLHGRLVSVTRIVVSRINLPGSSVTREARPGRPRNEPTMPRLSAKT